MYRILVVEDDRVIAGVMRKHLEKWGYGVCLVEDFSDVLKPFADFKPHLVLMDILLPFYNGHYWCSRIRQVSQVPVIFISSAGDNMNIVMSVQMGGDDFLVKPFGLDVLSAKVQAVLRRSYEFHAPTNLMEHHGLLLDLSDASLSVPVNATDASADPSMRKLSLTKNEFRILELLFERSGSTVSREEIMKRLWEDDCFVDDNTLTVNMARLRRKLEENGVENLIQTKKGLGYYIEK